MPRLRLTPLTTAENETLRLLIEGKTTEEAAAVMSVSKVTVEQHVEAIVTKLTPLFRKIG